MFMTFFSALPWIFVALAAILAWRQSKKLPILLQALAAALAFIIPISGWVIIALLNLAKVPWEVRDFLGKAFAVFGYFAFLAFAATFCWDRFMSLGKSGKGPVGL